ncbi:Vacuolar protein sorting-associated protein 41 [Lamellibrachia satsuma]|nr:Vacuolar protein sorting-associated protein 41 [Lamellibrachia satsuma]
MFEEAMVATLEHGKTLKRHDYQDIGKQYLNFLLAEERYEDAARLCVKILGRNREMWEEEVFKFAQIHQLKAIALYLPRGEPSLSPAIYEMVLNEYLQTDLLGFQKLVKEWPSELYNIQTLVNAVLDKLDRDRNNAILLQCLGDLYTHERRYDQALGIYLRLKNKDVFDLILKHNLFAAISDKIVMLMEFDQTTAVQMLLDNRDKIPTDRVVQQLEARPEFLHEYLDLLFKKDPHTGQEFHALQVELYAEFDRLKLLPFLRSSNYYPLQKALDVCQQRSLIPEMVFLLGRMGNTKQALHLITNDLRDVNAAIDFCKEHNDTELWNDLISYSIDKPSFITGLLQNIGTHVDPIVLIQQIRAGMEIPGLRDSLVKILQDYNLQMSLREGCKKILVADCFNLLQKLVRLQHKGVLIDEAQMCEACHEKIIANDTRYTSNVALFHCHHTFHEDCLPTHSMDACLICSAQRRGPGLMS